MKFVLYLLILLGATLLGFDLASEIRNIEKEPVPEPTQPVRAEQQSADSNPHGGHAEVIEAIEQQIADLTEKILQSPEDASLHLERGKLYAQMRQFDQALADLDKASALAPENHEIYFQRGYVQIATGKADQATDEFSRVLEIKPSHTQARLYRAIIRYRNGKFQPALDDCLELLKHDPTFYDAHITASRCYMELNNKAKAIEHLETYIANSNDPEGMREARRLISMWNEQSVPPEPSHDNQ